MRCVGHMKVKREHIQGRGVLHTYMGGCQNYGPFLGPIIIRHLIFRDPKGDHSFDNHPYTYIHTHTLV